MELRVVDNKKTDGKPPEIKIDKRTLPKTIKPPNVKHLRYSRKLPTKCDDCPYRSKQAGGNGICSVYKEGELCIIRKDIRNAVQRYSTRNPDKILPLLEEDFESNYEKLKFFGSLENMSAALDPEVTKRMNAVNNLAKTINELKSKKSTIELEQKKTLTDDKKNEIAQIIRIHTESSDEST
ncbi:hypothetical protein [Nitrosopumilus sp.]|uniref:hypothetical protein n=1 Tax=Nitrosopumilus sp. TaxID=2024843 RepID=UPI003D11DF0F